MKKIILKVSGFTTDNGKESFLFETDEMEQTFKDGVFNFMALNQSGMTELKCNEDNNTVELKSVPMNTCFEKGSITFSPNHPKGQVKTY